MTEKIISFNSPEVKASGVGVRRKKAKVIYILPKRREKLRLPSISGASHVPNGAQGPRELMFAVRSGSGVWVLELSGPSLNPGWSVIWGKL